jgi:hypothetical protein
MLLRCLCACQGHALYSLAWHLDGEAGSRQEQAAWAGWEVAVTASADHTFPVVLVLSASLVWGAQEHAPFVMAAGAIRFVAGSGSRAP